MKIPRTLRRPRSRAGFSLLELSLVMVTILGLTAAIGFGVSSIQKWKKSKNASLSLQAVYAAQRGYMADHPLADIGTVTSTQLKSYLPQGFPEMPVVQGLSGESLSVDFSVMPPTFVLGTFVYDPSGKSDDGLWDTGE